MPPDLASGTMLELALVSLDLEKEPDDDRQEVPLRNIMRMKKSVIHRGAG
jgi:hypothetical protein